MTGTTEISRGGIVALVPQVKAEKNDSALSKGNTKIRTQKKVRTPNFEQELRCKEVRVELRVLLKRMTHEEGDSFSSWRDIFLAILDKADLNIYQENKRFFHQILDFFIDPPKEIKGEVYLPVQKELGTRIRPFDTLKATAIIWKYTYCSQRIPALIQEARVALQNGRKEGALIWLERAKELIPHHQGGLSALNRQYEEERCTYIISIAELEGEISPLKGIATLQAHIKETAESPLFPTLFSKCFETINTLCAAYQVSI